MASPVNGMGKIKQRANLKRLRKVLGSPELFARGKYKLVYRKGKKYPLKTFLAHGNVVAFVWTSNPAAGMEKFWEMKLIRELFPKNVVKVHAVETSPEAYLLHSEEVLADKCLRKYMKLAIARMGHDLSSKEYADLTRQMRANTHVSELSDKMKAVGVDPRVYLPRGNPSNVSLHNPSEPVFFEPKIIDVDLLRQNIPSIGLSIGGKERAYRYLKRYLYWRKEKAKAEKQF